MNSYLISPKNNVYFNRIKEYVCLNRKGSGRKPSSKSAPILVDCQKTFDKESFKGAFRNPTNTDTIFIVPELNWDNDYSIEAGYKIAIKLITEKLPENSFVNILFVSLFTQEQLNLLVGTEYAEMVRSFPHISLSEILKDYCEKEEKDRTPVPVPVYSEIHYELLKRVVVQKTGQLDFIKHKLAHLTHIDNTNPDELGEDIKNAKENIRKILDLLSLPSFGGENEEQSKSIKECKILMASATSRDAIVDLVAKLRQLIDDIKTRFSKPQDSPYTNRSGYKVLVVEDDEYYKKKLQSFFEKHLGCPEENIEVCDNATIMSNGGSDILSKIKKTAGEYNIVFLDMMFTRSGMEDDISVHINGFDLYQALRDAEAKAQKRKAVVRVVTALPRNDISRLVNKYMKTETPVIFTKGNGWEQLEGCLLDRLDEIIHECEKNEDTFLNEKPFPKRGIFRHPGMFDAIVAHKEKEYKAAMEYAQAIANGKEKMSDCSLTTKKDPKEMISHLNAIMASRRLVIKFLRSDMAPIVQNDGGSAPVPYFDEDCYRDFIREYMTITSNTIKKNKAENNFDKGYLQTKLGFKVSQLPDRTKDRNDGQLSRKEKQSGFTGLIDLDAYLNFFPGELDCPEEEGANTALNDFIKKAVTILIASKKKLAGKECDVTDAYRESTIDVFLSSENKTPDSFKTMLAKVYNYIIDNKIAKMQRSDLQGVIADMLDLIYIEEPNRRKKIKNVAKDIDSLLMKIYNKDLWE